MDVAFTCGESNKIEDVTEPSMCHYKLVFITPLSCEALQSIQVKETAASGTEVGLSIASDQTTICEDCSACVSENSRLKIQVSDLERRLKRDHKRAKSSTSEETSNLDQDGFFSD